MSSKQVTMDEEQALLRSELEAATEACAQAAPGAAADDARERLGGLLRRALDADYTARSCKDAIATGNHYQSVRLGDEVTSGFRRDRREFLDLIDFRGRTVVDLGCNLGELSRSARARGASSVLGIEYDEWFLAIARGVNAYNATTDVTFVHGDVTDPATLPERADIVLGFSVWTYIAGVLPRLAEVVQEALIIETHNLDGNLERDYLRPITRLFPAYAVLGASDWGGSFEPTEGRAVLAFAKDESALDRVVTRPSAPIDISRPAARGAAVDVERTTRFLHERFLTVFPFEDTDDLLAAVRATEVDADAFASSDEPRNGYRGWLYWYMVLRGWLAYRDAGEVRQDNPHVRHLLDRHLPAVQEPGRSGRLSAEDACEIARRRFRDLDAFAAWDRDDPRSELPVVSPLRVVTGDVSSPNPARAWLAGERRPRAVRSLDGWHRLFAARLFGVAELPCSVVREATADVEGHVERVAYDGSVLHLSGWLLNEASPAQAFEVRAGGRTLHRAALVTRDDVAEAYPAVGHARGSGFAAQVPCGLTEGELRALEVVALADWLPVGRLPVSAHG